MVDWLATYQGVNLGGPANNVGIVSITGLEDLPNVRSGDTSAARNPGVMPGLDFPGSRVFVADLEMTPDAGVSLAATLERVSAALAPSMNVEYPFNYQLPGVVQKTIFCRVRKRSTPVDIAYAGGMATMLVQFEASDPRKYSTSVTNPLVTLPAPSSGMTFPATFPLTFGGTVGGGGIITAVNAGNYPTFPVATITGPCINPRIQNNATGAVLGITITLNAGDVLVLDMAAHTAILNASGYRAATVTTPGWFALAPGSTQVSFYSSDPAPTGATLGLAWRSAWL